MKKIEESNFENSQEQDILIPYLQDIGKIFDKMIMKKLYETLSYRLYCAYPQLKSSGKVVRIVE